MGSKKKPNRRPKAKKAKTKSVRKSTLLKADKIVMNYETQEVLSKEIIFPKPTKVGFFRKLLNSLTGR